uniref:Uncharacterized protein n=1 Tax=Lactuca sativa TaxID=4236 RepID=A0A9R1VPM4_LACSA|nr:hypothetical protein LSAT_V11C400171940 [Lactuca sativa]
MTTPSLNKNFDSPFPLVPATSTTASIATLFFPSPPQTPRSFFPVATDAAVFFPHSSDQKYNQGKPKMDIASVLIQVQSNQLHRNLFVA